MDKLYCISSFCFQLICGQELPIPDNFRKFEIRQCIQSEFTYELNMTRELPFQKGKVLVRRPDLTVLGKDSRESRILHCAYMMCQRKAVLFSVSSEMEKSIQTERRSYFQPFSMLYTQITVNQWNRDYVQCSADLLEDLIGQVPVWMLTCDISEDAVRCVESAIFPENILQEGGSLHEI